MHFKPKYDLLQVLAFIISMISEIVGVNSTTLDPSISKVASILRSWSVNCLVEISNMGLIYTSLPLGTSIHKIEAEEDYAIVKLTPTKMSGKNWP